MEVMMINPDEVVTVFVQEDISVYFRIGNIITLEFFLDFWENVFSNEHQVSWMAGPSNPGK